ncbi:MAG: class I SAM-dependent methyltransferase [Planctomycetia bacterium]
MLQPLQPGQHPGPSPQALGTWGRLKRRVRRWVRRVTGAKRREHEALVAAQKADERALAAPERALREEVGIDPVQHTGPTWTRRGPPDPRGLVPRLEQAVAQALSPSPPLAPEVRALEGMSGQRYRALVGALLAQLPGARYLEVGSWLGSTACAALHGNHAHGLCIDNWSLFAGPKDEFLRTMQALVQPPASWEHLEADFRAVDYTRLGCFDVYLFDGPHGRQDQHAGVLLAQPALAPTCVLVVDDWNWAQVRLGTLEALRDLGAELHACLEVRTSLDGTHGEPRGRDSDWHNGYFVAVVSKRAAT